jgi:methionyl-tRNA synthetase
MSFYITTPIYYVNDTPHIGHAYCTVVADVIRKYRRLFGEDTYLLTGVDEHGQKVEEAAKKRGMSSQAHCDDMAPNFKKIWEELEIDYDFFFRTTDDFHKKAVQAALTELHKKGDIYAKDYEGWYAQSDEIFYTEKDLVDGKAPTGASVVKITEKNYFFRMSKYQQQLIDHIQSHPNFIQPEFRKNEVLGFLRQPLHDLCISRPKARMSWGIELPFDADFVTYVWFDALLNYVTALGYQQPGKDSALQKRWNDPKSEVVHLLGKDILTTHSVYWPTMLMALGVPLPKVIFAHGWWLTANNEKMSKSQGPVVKPLDIKDLIGVDALRYFLTRDIRLGQDSQFAVDLVVSRVNADLANNMGNLLSRTLSLVAKYFDSKVPDGWQNPSEKSKALGAAAVQVGERVQSHIRAMETQEAVVAIMDLMTLANQYLADQAPWKQAKEDLPAAAETLYTSLECLRIAGILLSPILPKKTQELLNRVGWSQGMDFKSTQTFGRLRAGDPVINGDPLFPRIDLNHT